MTDPSSWQVTTHDWGSTVDHDHLAAIRDELSLGGRAGGRRHLILEVLAYADEEAEAQGRTGRATLAYHPDGSVTVADDGRGTDTRRDGRGRVIRKPVMATADVRFADPADRPVLPDGLPRGGMSAVAALSRELVHENHRAGGSWSQTYRFGVPDDELRAIEASAGTGTSVTFVTDVEGPSRIEAQDVTGFPWLEIIEH
ncbi:ATP-binding protein [Ornithinimicrobium sp. F0845]|uniref:ATP-binding protein n=1 Tax=Ornithinimicrobium sp. F0845 TaxID=2926412 RepID=UPI001FF112C0|nr:ATP-binding protein [Ornithinimicrobium sp. F0845]MCK0112509.1 ATP-binding protein [Ornithinimicrobium sp. F0845]